MPRTQAGSPTILAFARPVPEPVLRYWQTFVLRGRRYRFEGFRWLDEDVRHLDHEAQPDPHLAGTSFSVRMIDVETGQIIGPVSFSDPSANPDGRSRPRGA